MVTANRIKEELDRAESSSRTEWKGREGKERKKEKQKERSCLSTSHSASLGGFSLMGNGDSLYVLVCG